MPEFALAGLAEQVADAARVLTAPAAVDRLSKDFYWYSPVLKRQLAEKTGDVAVQPVNVEEVLAIARYAREHNIPLTARGAGTGNYGQCIPLEGGIIVDLSRMDRVEEITAEGVAVCEPGVRLAALEQEATARGFELRMYPSTLAKATVGGFLAGGSGGIGSIAHGMLRDFDTVRALEFVTMEDEPRVVRHAGAGVHEILHCWGTNGILTRVWLALTPAVAWSQYAVAFPTYEAAYHFAREVAESEAWTKRLVTVFEWPIPTFFTPVKQVMADGQALIFFMIATAQDEAFREAVARAGGQVTFSGAYTGPRTQPLLSDYTWNHTTLWAMKADPVWTYLQAGFSRTDCLQQCQLLRARFGDEILFHLEFMKTGDGQIIPGSIPLVRFTTEERLNEMIGYCLEIGMTIANPHVNYLEDSGRFRADNVQLLAKERYDPRGLLNPGKMLSFRPERRP
ncbi:MAG: FAD-binding oxidoreductase [Bryobacteraceae bacterium]|nr:FAD-binding oxidoreductase [Bryobacteraceae bacterium]